MKKNVIEEQTKNDNNYKKLKELFPHAVSLDENGKYVIDPKKLQMSLDPSKAEIREDGYGLNWVGKKEAYHSAFSKNYKVLKPLKDDSKNWDETENILIKGDNLDALKILRHNYFESIKMIYIDPPYNTKNDGFVYNDDFTASTEQTLEELGYDKEYIDYIENIQGAKTHSGWLSFMYPRLLLAKDLLKDDGVIFISIDDNEVAQLRLLCDEVFGEENHLATLKWKRKKQPSYLHGHVAKVMEYILVYSKEEIEKLSIEKRTDSNTRMDNASNDKSERIIPKGTRVKLDDEIKVIPKGIYKNKSMSTEYLDDVIIQNGRTKNDIRVIAQFRNQQSEIKKFVDNDVLFITKNYGFRRDLLPEELEKRKAIVDLITEWGDNQDSDNEMKKLFGEHKPFSYPKPVNLIKNFILSIFSENEIILDFFAGSGTTAQSIFESNMDGGNRKFILVQIPEVITTNNVSTKQEKEEIQKTINFIKRELGKEIPTIFDITQERIKRAGILFKKGDIGFRTFEIVEDQKQKIYQKSLEEVSQDDLVAMMEKPDIESNEEILYNLFVAEALPLSTKHQELIKDKLYLASNVAFILGDITSNELVEALKGKKECEYITVYSPNISNDKFTLEIESNISKLGIKPDKLRFRG
jgi:adenine-specific DNA-methyltransferase